jgi:uncharacterized membrane protein (UPF0136 family)
MGVFPLFLCEVAVRVQIVSCVGVVFGMVVVWAGRHVHIGETRGFAYVDGC